MRLRVGTYNILHGADFPRKRKTGEDVVELSLYDTVLRELSLDICGLNEVRNQERVEGLCHQARVLAERLGCYYAFSRAIDHRGGEYGNALLSRFVVRSLVHHPLVIPESERLIGVRYEDRVILEAHLDVSGREVVALVTHFGLHADEIALAAKTLVSIAERCTLPVIAMGDFNVTPDHEAIAVLKRCFVDTADISEDALYTFPSHKPDRKIDYLMVKGDIRVRSVRVADVLASDHKPLVAELEIE